MTNLLLVAAIQLADGLFVGRALHLQPAQNDSVVLFSARLSSQPAEFACGQWCLKRGVDPDGLGRQQSSCLRIFGHEANAGAQRVSRTANDHRLPADKNLPRCLSHPPPKIRAQGFGAAGTNQTRKAPEFSPRRTSKLHIAHPVARPQIAHRTTPLPPRERSTAFFPLRQIVGPTMVAKPVRRFTSPA